MATPSPISAIRNSTIWLTAVKCVSPPSARKVVRIEIPAITSGTNARKLANTNASTTSAPSAPSIASATTPAPLPAGLPVVSACIPVTRTCQSAGTAALTARWIREVRSPGDIGSLCGANTSA